MATYTVYIGRGYTTGENYDKFWWGYGNSGQNILRTAFATVNRGESTYSSNTPLLPTNTNAVLKLADNEYPTSISFTSQLCCRQKCYGALLLTCTERNGQNNHTGDIVLGTFQRDGNAYPNQYDLPLSTFNASGTWTALQGKTLALGKSQQVSMGDVWGLAIRATSTVTITTAYVNATVSYEVNQSSWGTVSIANTTLAPGGQTTVTITPNSGYIVQEVSATNGSISYTNDGNYYTYTMSNPPENAVIHVLFRPQVEVGSVITKTQMDAFRTFKSNNATAVTQGDVITAAIGNTYHGNLKISDPIEARYYNKYIWDDGDDPSVYHVTASPPFQALTKDGNANTQITLYKYGCIVFVRVSSKSGGLTGTIAKNGTVATIPASCAPSSLVMFANISMPQNKFVISANGTSILLHNTSATNGNWLSGSTMYIANDNGANIQSNNFTANGLAIQLRKVGHIASISINGTITSAVNNWAAITSIPDDFRPQGDHHVFMRELNSSQQTYKNAGIYLEAENNVSKIRIGNMNAPVGYSIQAYSLYITN